MAYEGPNYTQTPNQLLDEHLPDMGCAELKVVLAVCRKTWGWQNTLKGRLTTKDLMERTGLSNRAVIDGVEAAIERGVLAREEDGNTYRYWLRVEGWTMGPNGYEQSSQADAEGCEQSSQGCEESSQEGVNNAHTPSSYKDKEKKDSSSKRNSSTSSDETEEDAPLPPEERVEYEWTYDYARAALKHFRSLNLLGTPTKKKIDREGEEEVCVEWADTFRLLHEQDGYSPEEIQMALSWLFDGGNFWTRKKAIRSVPPLRSKTRTGDQYKFDAIYHSAQASHESDEPESFEENVQRLWDAARRGAGLQ